MNKPKFLIFMSLMLVMAILLWASGDAFAQAKATKGAAKQVVAKDAAKEKVAKDVAAKGKVTRDDQAKYLGKKTPSELKAAQKRARLLGLKPGIAGRAAQAPGPAGAPQTN